MLNLIGIKSLKKRSVFKCARNHTRSSLPGQIHPGASAHWSLRCPESFTALPLLRVERPVIAVSPAAESTDTLWPAQIDS